MTAVNRNSILEHCIIIDRRVIISSDSFDSTCRCFIDLAFTKSNL